MTHWKSILALLLIPVTFYFNWTEFYFSILFLIWSVQAVKNQEVHLIETIYKSESPILFWHVTVLWFVLSILGIIYSEPLRSFTF